MSLLRVFIAIEVTDEIRAMARRLARDLSQSGAKVKWVDPDTMHLTLKFLGDVDETQIHRVCQATSEAVKDITP